MSRPEPSELSDRDESEAVDREIEDQANEHFARAERFDYRNWKHNESAT